MVDGYDIAHRSGRRVMSPFGASLLLGSRSAAPCGPRFRVRPRLLSEASTGLGWDIGNKALAPTRYRERP
jgi:hypothetical protein